MQPEDKDFLFGTVGAGLKWAIRELVDRGMKFQAVEVKYDGGILLSTPEPIEPNNVHFLYTLRQGRMVSPIVAIQVALDMIERHEIDLDTTPLHDVLTQVKTDVEMAKEWAEDFPVEWGKWFESQMEKAGLAKVGGAN
jgi:hypothetical protein